MQEFDLSLVAKKSVRGVFALISRTLVLQIISFFTYFLVLVPVLGPEPLGIFTITSAILVFFSYFQDIGLAASLIQKQHEPTIHELRTVFTIQQLLVLVLVVPAFIFSKSITNFYNLDEQGHLLFIALLISFVLTSLRTIPTIILERKLDFHKLVIPQIGEMLVYNALLIILALSGYGITSFTIAVIARSIVGLVLTYIIQPWDIGFSFNIEATKKLISFGIPFQVNSFLALLKDDLLIIYIGKVLSFSQVGYVGFSQKLAFTPLRLVMDNVIRVTFPSYSRLQSDPAALKFAIEKSLFLISFLMFPTAVAIIFFSSYLLEFIPRYQQWQPAILSVVFFSLSTIFSSISTPLTNLLNAIGKVKTTLYFMIFWTLATWVSTLILIELLRFNGVAVASFVVSITSVFVVVVARRYVKFSFIKPVVRQLLGAVIMGIFILAIQGFITSLLMLVFAIILSAILYLSFIFLVARMELISIAKYIIRVLREV